MLNGLKSPTLELRLLLACAKVRTSREDEAVIRRILDEGIDWTLLARKAVDHGLAGLAGHTLARVAPEMVPDDILDALRVNIEQTYAKNRFLFDELTKVIEALANTGIEAIPFKGPVLALRAYGDLGLRVFRDLDFLIRDVDLAPTIATLRSAGYERTGHFTEAQFDQIHRIQGQEIIFKQSAGTAVEPHTRLTPIKMALDIDYAGLWLRAERTRLNGRSMLTLAPEDELVTLAIHGGKEMWWNIKWACDVAAFIGSHAKLDWNAIAARARAQGCLRIVLLATSLARRCFNATVPDFMVAAESADPTIEAMVGRIMVHWQADEPIGPPSNKTLSGDRLRLHDGFARQAKYVARTLFLPGPHHVGLVRLPKNLSFAYVPLKIGHDILALPLWRAYRQVRSRARSLGNVLAGSDLALAMVPASSQTKRFIRSHREVRAAAKRALAADPNNVAALVSLGNALSGLKRYREAIVCYDKALAIVPDSKGIWKYRGTAVRAVRKNTTLADFDEEQPLDSQDANAWARHAGFLLASQRFEEAAAASDRALAINPKHLIAMRIGIRSRASACDWHRREDDQRRISDGVNAGMNIVTPFNHRAICESDAENLSVARIWAKGFPRPKALWRNEIYRHGRIRVAYLSADFRDHATSILMAGVFEHHNRTRFETIAFSHGPDDGSTMRRRIEASMDRFIDARTMSDIEVATMLRELEVDIAIDLNGHAGAGRTGILAHRPAPVQINYLGNAGTMGAPFFDYIIADRIVIPKDHAAYYTEKVVYLPHSYQCNDSRRYVPKRAPSRVDAGLPESGFVFCCFNNNFKIAPPIFAIWMRLLSACPGSVLWLLGEYPYAMHNLRREAVARGVAPERLVFAPRIPVDDHLARHRLADLFLDTLPYNAHTTASDALWAGLPVLTCLGKAFPGRVAASLLLANGLPELVTSSLTEYEELALALARDPDRLAAIKAKLARNRDTEPLFDTARFTRDLETAYTVMWERTQRGEPPASFSVPGVPRFAERQSA